MKTTLTFILTLLFITAAVSVAADKETVMANEKAAWQAFKDKNVDAFKKVLDKDLRCVYTDGIFNLQQQVDDMKNWDLTSVTFSDFDAFSDEPDVYVTTYKVVVEATYNGKDISGTYNAGSVWKKEKNEWLGIFHTSAKVAAEASPTASP